MRPLLLDGGGGFLCCLGGAATILAHMPTPGPTPAARDLLLKVTPPRLPPYLVARPAFHARRTTLRESPVLLVQAPAGFGKTSLLAQWRRDCIAQGDAVAWVSAQAEDHAERFLQSLALSVRIASGRPAFGQVLMEAPPANALEGVTTWQIGRAHV